MEVLVPLDRIILSNGIGLQRSSCNIISKKSEKILSMKATPRLSKRSSPLWMMRTYLKSNSVRGMQKEAEVNFLSFTVKQMTRVIDQIKLLRKLKGSLAGRKFCQIVNYYNSPAAT